MSQRTRQRSRTREADAGGNGQPARDILDRQPPANLGAERGVLGSVLLLPSVIDDVITILHPEDFHDDANRRIFRHFVAIHDAGQRVDLTLLIDRLKSANEYDTIGGAAYLHEVGESVPHAASAKYYAEIIKDKAIKRALIAASTDTMRDAHDDRLPAAEIAARASEKVAAIAAAHSRDNGAVVECFATMTAEDLVWLWRNVLLIGAINLLFGDPGDGKSLVSTDFAARVSAGLGWPDTPHDFSQPGSVLMLAAEDSHSATIRPRLSAAGADLENVFAFRGVSAGPPNARPRSPRLPLDLAMVEAAIEKLRHPRLVIVDPMDSFLSGVDHNNDVELRAVLTPLASLAEDKQAAVLALTHGRKATGRAVHSALGSIGMVGAARVVWQIKRDPHNSRRRLLLPTKCNLSDDESGWAFEIRPNEDGVPVIAWEAEPIRMRADDLDDGTVKSEQRAEQRRQSKARDEADARDRLLAVLRDLYPKGETESRLTSLAHLGRERAPRLLSQLRRDGIVETCPVTKSDRKTPRQGYRLKEGTNDEF